MAAMAAEGAAVESTGRRRRRQHQQGHRQKVQQQQQQPRGRDGSRQSHSKKGGTGWRQTKMHRQKKQQRRGSLQAQLLFKAGVTFVKCSEIET